MAAWRPDPTFYPSPRLAAQAPPERLACVATMNPTAAFPARPRDRRSDLAGGVKGSRARRAYPSSSGTPETPARVADRQDRQRRRPRGGPRGGRTA